MLQTIQTEARQYIAVFDPDEHGGFTVTIPSLPGCISEGETFEEALANIKEAAALYLEDLSAEELDSVKQIPVLAPVEVSFAKTT